MHQNNTIFYFSCDSTPLKQNPGHKDRDREQIPAAQAFRLAPMPRQPFNAETP